MALARSLIDALVAKLDVTPRHINRLIIARSNSDLVSRKAAALLIARDNNVGFQKYASAEDLAEMRGVSRQQPTTSTSSYIPAPVKTAASRAPTRKPPKPTRNNSIFVVHGRDSDLTDDIYGFLRAIGLNPIEWNEAIKGAKGGANPIVGEIIDQAMKKAHGIMVLLSPDEEAKLKPKFASQREKKMGLDMLDGQPRPNVIFEAGLALGAHSDKTILVQVGDIRDISDIAGKHMAHLTNKPASRKALAMRLKTKLKFKVNIDGDVWLDIGNFDR